MHTASASAAIRAERERPELVPRDALKKFGITGRDWINDPHWLQIVAVYSCVLSGISIPPHW